MRHVLFALLALPLAACPGANLNQRAPGNRAGGTWLESGDIAVDPAGRHAFVRIGQDLFVGDLAGEHLTRIDGVAEPDLLAFWPAAAGDGFYALSRSWPRGSTLVSYDLAAGEARWSRDVEVTPDRLDVTPDGRRVILSDPDVALIDAATGADAGRYAAGAIVDLDVAPASDRVIVTERTAWTGDAGAPVTRIRILSGDDAALLCSAEVPNCADELAVHPDGERAYLAPTSCAQDPVSVIDVTADCRFEQNLPGFGPVALTRDGATGVAFLHDDAGYSLMMFDTATLETWSIPAGRQPPRYALTPDDATLVLDGLDLRDGPHPEPPPLAPGEAKQTLRIDAAPVRLVDLATRQVREASGPEVLLQWFVLDDDSRHAWIVHADRWKADGDRIDLEGAGLYQLDVAAAQVAAVPLPFEPDAINAIGGGAVLILRDGDRLQLYDVAAGAVTATLSP